MLKGTFYPHVIHIGFVDFTPFDIIIHIFTVSTTITTINYYYIHLL